ncbi:MAG: 30S ribosome-binding factor RbfA, partial [Armatimonadota bacterium]
GFVTLTDVAVSVDLRHARVYVSVLGDEASRRGSLRALGRAAKYIRAQLAKRVDLKFVPQLAFHHDRTAERAQRIEGLLRDIAAERTDAIGTGENSEDHTAEGLVPPDDA